MSMRGNFGELIDSNIRPDPAILMYLEISENPHSLALVFLGRAQHFTGTIHEKMFLIAGYCILCNQGYRSTHSCGEANAIRVCMSIMVSPLPAGEMNETRM